MQQQPESVILRYRARLSTTQPQSLRPYRANEKQELVCFQDEDRVFIIEVHAFDDTIAVYETKTSGGFGGCIFARSRVPSKIQSGQYIKMSDIYSGTVLSVAGRMFEVLEADAFTMKYVRENPLLFPQRTLTSLLRAIVDAQLVEPLAYALCQHDLSACGYVLVSEFLQILNITATRAITLQDRISLAQEYATETSVNSSELKISYLSFMDALRAIENGPNSEASCPYALPPTQFVDSKLAASDEQLMLRRRLLARGLSCGNKFLTALVKASRSSHGFIDKFSIQHALPLVGIRDLSPLQLDKIVSSFSDVQPSVHDVLLSVQNCFNSGARSAMCAQFFTKLDKRGTGIIFSSDLVGAFNSMAACHLLQGHSSSTMLRTQWIEIFHDHISASGTISMSSFLNAMRQLSWIFVDEKDFAVFFERCLGARIPTTAS
jgi:hypothetical protein